MLEERDRQRKREVDKEWILICKNIKCQKSINKETAVKSKHKPVVVSLEYNKYIQYCTQCVHVFIHRKKKTNT